MHPDFGEYIRRVVDVLKSNIACERMCPVVERYANGVINFLLEIRLLGMERQTAKQAYCPKKNGF